MENVITDILVLEPVCGWCGEYYEMVPMRGMWDEFSEWRCGCRVKVLSVRQEHPIYDKLISGKEKSVFMNGLWSAVMVQGWKHVEVGVQDTVVKIREFVDDKRLSEEKGVLKVQLKELLEGGIRC